MINFDLPQTSQIMSILESQRTDWLAGLSFKVSLKWRKRILLLLFSILHSGLPKFRMSWTLRKDKGPTDWQNYCLGYLSNRVFRINLFCSALACPVFHFCTKERYMSALLQETPSGWRSNIDRLQSFSSIIFLTGYQEMPYARRLTQLYIY